MFRVALKNDMISTKIDVIKAILLPSVNAIIVSLALSNLLLNEHNLSNEYLILLAVILIILSILLSIRGTRPSITEGNFTKQYTVNNKVIFFDNFHKITHY